MFVISSMEPNLTMGYSGSGSCSMEALYNSEVKVPDRKKSKDNSMLEPGSRVKEKTQDQK